VLLGAAPGAVSAAPTPVPVNATPAPGPASAPSVRPAISPVPVASPLPAIASAASPVPTPSPPEVAPADQQQDVDWRTFVPSDTADHLATMDRAARDSGCGVPWQLLAAISRVESDFGRNMATSTAGAIGYGQFLPSSWAAFGNEGNAYDYRDVLPAIARYLCQSGLARDPRAALFAYNHADWYVDLVLDLAVKYDRMAPGAPIPQVLDVNPGAPAPVPIHYAAGRDLALQAKRFEVDGAGWLGVPWRGRPTGSMATSVAMQSAALGSVLGAFGMTRTPAAPSSSDLPLLDALAARAWDAGLLAWPSASPSGWSLAELRKDVARGLPVVLVVDGAALPGHPDPTAHGDQPLLVVGAATSGLIVNDPSFASSLGYGLEISDVDLLKAWESASTPLQGIGFSRAPRQGSPHERPLDMPPVVARVVVTPPAAARSAEPGLLELPVALAAPTPEVIVLDVTVAPRVETAQPAADWSWLVLVVGGAAVGAAVAIRQWRGRSSAAPGWSGRGAGAPPLSDR
jgi:hypothetical protein